MAAGSIIQQLKAIASLDIGGFKQGVKEFVAEVKTLKTQWKDAATDIAQNGTAKISQAVSTMAGKVSQAALDVNSRVKGMQNQWNQTSSSIVNGAVNAIGNAVGRMAQMVARGANTVAQSANPIGTSFGAVAGTVASAASSIVGSVGRIATATARTASAVWKSTEEMRKAWVTAARDINSAINRTALVVGGMVAGVVGIGFKFNNTAQQAKLAFQTMLGSATAADRMMKSIFKFAEKTPFNVEGVIDGARKLLAMGFASERILPTLETVSDAVAGLGGGAPMLDRVIRALGQINTKGKLQAQEMMQLTENGIAAWDMLARHLNTTVADAMERVTAGTISSDVAITALMNGMQQKFGGLSQAQSKTFGGMLSNIQDFASRAAGDVTRPLFDAISRIMSRFLQASNGPGIRGFLANLQQQFSALGQWLERTLPMMISDFRAMMPAILDAARAFGQFLGGVAKFLIEHPKLAAALLALKMAGFLGITQAAGATVTALMKTTQIVGTLITSVGALKFALGVGLVGAIAAVVLKLTGAIPVMQAWLRENERARRLNDELLTLEEKRHRQTMRKAESMNDNPAAKNAFLEKQIAEIKKNLDMLKSAAESSGKAEDKQRLADAQRRLEEFQAAKVTPEEIAARQREAQQQAAANKPLPTVAAPDVAADAEAEAGAEEKRAERVRKMAMGFGDALDDFVRDGEATKAELAEVYRQGVMLVEQARQGKITIEQLEQGLETLELGVKSRHDQKVAQEREAEQLRSSAIDSGARFVENMREIAREGGMSGDSLLSLAKRAEELAAQVVRGDITLDDMNRELSDLAWSANAVANASKKAAEHEQELAKLRAIASGNFAAAGINPREELLRRIAALRMQQFNNMIDGAAKSLLGLSDQTDKTREGMSAFEGGFAGAFAGSRSGGGGFDEALSKLQNFLMSREGAIVSLKNQIALLQQNINVGRTFGLPADRLRQWETMITQLLQQLNALTETPTFSSFDTDMRAPVDPVLVRDANNPPPQQPGNVNITMSLPGATLLTPAVADHAFEMVRQAGYRRLGVDPFSRESYR